MNHIVDGPVRWVVAGMSSLAKKHAIPMIAASAGQISRHFERNSPLGILTTAIVAQRTMNPNSTHSNFNMSRVRR